MTFTIQDPDPHGPFAEWHEFFPSAAFVVSLVDRLVHRAEIISIEGECYRLKEARERTAQRKGQRAKKKIHPRTRPNPGYLIPQETAMPLLDIPQDWSAEQAITLCDSHERHRDTVLNQYQKELREYFQPSASRWRARRGSRCSLNRRAVQ